MARARNQLKASLLFLQDSNQRELASSPRVSRLHIRQTAPALSSLSARS